jgi:predicted CopG family antitoxin
MKVRGEKLKRRRRPSKSFGELIRRLLQPKPEELEKPLGKAKQKRPSAKAKRSGKS